MGKIKLKVEDVFRIPLQEKEIGFGQIIAFPNKSSLMIILFDKKLSVDDILNLADIAHSSILMLGNTFDAKVHHKDWQIIGNYSKNLDSVSIPFYKIGTPPNELYLTDYKGNILRELNESEFNKLNYQNFIAPIRFENALKAYFKIGEWKSEDYDKLQYVNSNVVI